MITTLWRRISLCVALLLGAGSGCTSLDISSNMSNAVDTTMGTYTSAQSDHYILVTMTDRAHESLIKGEMINREGRLPPLYASYLSRLARIYGLTRVADWPLSMLNVRCLVFAVNKAEQRDAIVTALAGERFVETAQPMQNFVTMGNPAGCYNDPVLNLQHALSSLQIEKAHYFATGKGVRVAVIDTGIDTQHEELRTQVIGTKNFVDRDARQFRSDIHGTAVASVIAASSNNKYGMVGVAPDASIIGLKACWQPKTATQRGNCNSFTLAKALNSAIELNVDVVNLSLAGPSDPLLERLVHRAIRENMLVVGAVSEQASFTFPGSIEGVIAAADDPMYLRANAQRILAPGKSILSAAPANAYEFRDGSSFSAAHVSGIVALMRQRKPHLRSDVVQELLRRSQDKDKLGANACVALSRLVGGTIKCASIISNQ